MPGSPEAPFFILYSSHALRCVFNCATNIATHSFIVQVIAAVTRLMTLIVILDPAIHPPRHIDVTYIWVLIM